MENSPLNEEKIIEQRKKKFLEFIKVKYEWISYIVLAILVFMAVWLRTLNLSKLRDVTTGGWTLGPDLDPFLFLRWAKDIVIHGSLMVNDTLRYVPIGFNTRGELILLPYMMAWFHKITVFFSGQLTVEHSAAVYPAVMFGFTVIAFFILTRKIFIDDFGKTKSNIIALIACFFLSVVPALLPRTIAGIPEKESTGFLFMFLAFYFFISMWKSKSIKSQTIFSILAGLSTAAMAMIWGGFIYILLTISIGLFMAFLLGQFDKRKLGLSWLWIIISYGLMYIVLPERYSISTIIDSTTTIIPLFILLIVTVHFLVYGTKLKKYLEKERLNKIPKPIISLILTILLIIILALIIYGPGYIGNKVGDITKPLITPITDRLGVTVAENKQPYFSEWADNFGPTLGSAPILFWLFFLGSIYLYFHMTKIFEKKERIIITIGYALFLFAIIFSRYSETSAFNGTNFQSLAFYVIGVLALICTFGYYYYKYYKKGEHEKLRSLDFGLVILFSLFFFSIVSARGGVRTIMVLVPPAAIIVGYFVVAAFNDVKKSKESSRTVLWILFILLLFLIMFSGIQLYRQTASQARQQAPYIYTFQWQKAMSWVRENTTENAVFAHWWDYGYWVQSIGNRATVLDGGNAITYWDYLMGRYALTGSNNSEALDFLYAHNTTHFLIDSTDIGKYGAFSSIGSNENYDRYSFILTFLKDQTKIQETKNSTIYLYTVPGQGGFPLDDNLVYDNNGSKVTFPSGKAAVGALLVERDKTSKIISVNEIILYNGKQFIVPIRYVYDSKFVDLGTGSEAGIFIFPAIVQSQSGQAIDKTGALFYMSNRTVKSQLARLYLYKEDNPNFKLVHSEDDEVVTSLKSQGALSADEDFVYYPGLDLRGPIRIWEINYPTGMKVNPVYLQTNYPNPALAKAR